MCAELRTLVHTGVCDNGCVFGALATQCDKILTSYRERRATALHNPQHVVQCHIYLSLLVARLVVVLNFTPVPRAFHYE